jgi:hypothetical protein
VAGFLKASRYGALPNAPVAQLDRASDFESEGREFESLRARQFSPSLEPLERIVM